MTICEFCRDEIKHPKLEELLNSDWSLCCCYAIETIKEYFGISDGETLQNQREKKE